MTGLLRTFLVLFVIYLLLVIFLFFYQEKMLYFPMKGFSQYPSEIGLPYREVTLKTADGVDIHGWLVGDREKGERDVVLFCHGNAGNISHRLDSLAVFDRLGLNVFIFDYRGYGRSRGKPSEEGTYRDVEAAWRFLTEEEKISPERVILFGRSLGGGVAAYLAAGAGGKAKALILESTFTSIPDLAAKMYPIFPVRLLSRVDYNTLGRLAGIHMPVLVVHSPGDEIIPFSHGKALFEAANESRQFLKISGSHNEGVWQSQRTYFAGLYKFLHIKP
ncbi:MAG: alpha/beta hydrolase [bacterium]|nr:alpha/beta hydrolase [bacterium]